MEYLIVGLGNPGDKYVFTRHNLGFQVIDDLADEAEFVNDKYLYGQVLEGVFSKKPVVFLKPQTFMNLSGKSVAAALRRYNIRAENLILIHDDLDVFQGDIKASFGRGSGGHKGVDSVINHLKTKDFLRLRVGIKPNEKSLNVSEFVLGKTSSVENDNIKEAKLKIKNLLSVYFSEGLDKAMSVYKKR